AKRRQCLALFVKERPLADDFAVGRASRSRLDLLDPDDTAGIEDHLLPEATDTGLVVADAAQSASLRIDLSFKELVADTAPVGQPHPCWDRLAGGFRYPGEAQRRHLDDQFPHVTVQLARLDRPLDRDRCCKSVKFQHDSTRETARIEQEMTRL